jgi:hypothetical protein
MGVQLYGWRLGDAAATAACNIACHRVIVNANFKQPYHHAQFDAAAAFIWRPLDEWAGCILFHSLLNALVGTFYRNQRAMLEATSLLN